ncbi:MAG TPA: PfkB family carbohydrate kinase [Verrucomicrobiota bacterium]|nr:PfkB family carbohydrate kinase [Verrucomicrobiota bacterium]
MNTPELRAVTATRLSASAEKAHTLKTFMGFDGFVDNILHAVDKRTAADHYERLPTIQRFASRIAAAAGKSTNIELVSQRIKLGGNGPIMANAMASFGLNVCYLGTLGHPRVHPAFAEFATRAETHSILDPGFTDAIEFEDGKIMLGKIEILNQFDWQLIAQRFGGDNLAARLNASDFAAFLNWTMFNAMNDIWSVILKDICPALTGPRRKLFFDLADPEKRTPDDIRAALKLISEFEKHFDVILGLNEKESHEIAQVLDLDSDAPTPEKLLSLAAAIRQALNVNTVVVHPVSFALAASKDDEAIVEGPFTPRPMITTGAGDHFNAGFCLGKLLELDNAGSVLTGVATSGFYVRTARSPQIPDLVELLNNWPSKS